MFPSAHNLENLVSLQASCSESRNSWALFSISCVQGYDHFVKLCATLHGDIPGAVAGSPSLLCRERWSYPSTHPMPSNTVFCKTDCILNSNWSGMSPVNEESSSHIVRESVPQPQRLPAIVETRKPQSSPSCKPAHVNWQGLQISPALVIGSH